MKIHSKINNFHLRNTDALGAFFVRRESARAGEQTQAPVRSIRVDAALVALTRIGQEAFVGVDARAKAVALEAGSA